MVRLSYLAPALYVGVLAVVFREHAFVLNCPLYELTLMEIYVLEGQRPTCIRDLESVIPKGITLRHNLIREGCRGIFLYMLVQ
jgi:hypothetical protein